MTKNTHGELCDLITEWQNKNCLFLLPRGTFKSSIITEGLVIQELLNDPNKTVLVYCETYTKAIDYVREIREHFSNHVSKYFGNIKDERYWREQGFRVKGRTRQSKEASVTPSGIDKPATGYHYDLIICDDLIGETNSGTADQLEKAQRRFEELHSILNPGGRIIVLGTIWDENDIYCNIIKQEGIEIKDWDKILKARKVIGKDWNIYIRQIKEGDKYFFPEKYNDKTLSKIERAQSDHHHKKQYYNDPRRLSNTIFTEEMRDMAKKLWSDEAIKNNGTPRVENKYILIDPAISQTERADYTGIIVLGVNLENKWFLIEAMQVKLDTEQLIETVITLYKQHHPKLVSMEARGFQKVILQWLHKRRKELGLYFKVYEYDPGNKLSKEQRIETLLPRFKSGTIGYSENMVELDYMLRKYPDFSSREHEDILDALAQATTVITKPTFLPCSPEDKKAYIKGTNSL